MGLLATSIVWMSANSITASYLRHNAPVVFVILGGIVLAAGLVALRGRAWRAVALVAAWALWGALSLLWSQSPSATVAASGWYFLYLAFFVLGIRWPRPYLVLFALVNVIIAAAGVDILLVTGSTLHKGVWYEKNIQGAQYLLLLPVLLHWAFGKHRYAPLLALPVGMGIYFTSLTNSVSSYILVLVGLAVIFVIYGRKLLDRKNLVTMLGIVALLAAGWGLGRLMVPPFDTGLAETIEAKGSTFTWRLKLLEDVGRRALAELPLGTGAGTMRNLLSNLQTHPGVESVDAHNYYLQTVMEVGPVGLVLLLGLFAYGLYHGYRNRRWGVLVALILFMGILAFSVPAYFPAIMMLYFGLLGVACSSPATGKAPALGARPASSWRWASLGVLVVPLLWSWWSLPCDDAQCALGRKLGDRDTVTRVFNEAAPETKLALAQGAMARNPNSLFAEELYASAYELTGDSEGFLQIRRHIAAKYPASDVYVFAAWCEAALAASQPDEAAEALAKSRLYYGDALQTVSSNLAPERPASCNPQ